MGTDALAVVDPETKVHGIGPTARGGFVNFPDYYQRQPERPNHYDSRAGCRYYQRTRTPSPFQCGDWFGGKLAEQSAVKIEN